MPLKEEKKLMEEIKQLKKKKPLQATLFDKKPPNLAQTLNFLSQNRVERLKFLRSKIEKIFGERGGSEGRQPPRGVIHATLSKLQNILPRNDLFQA